MYTIITEVKGAGDDCRSYGIIEANLYSESTIKYMPLITLVLVKITHNSMDVATQAPYNPSTWLNLL